MTNPSVLLELAGRVEALSLGYTDPPVEATKKRWYEALKPFAWKAHHHAANLAAHNWDALLIGQRVFLYQTKYGGDRGHWVSRDGSHEDATPAEMNALYQRASDGTMRRLFRDNAAQPPETPDAQPSPASTPTPESI